MTGRTIKHYEILDKLGEGGMGVVYKAHDTHLDRFAAIKVLRADAVADPTRKQRFVQEARAASALNHPNIITIYDISSEDGVDFIAMEYVAGKTIDMLIGRKGLSFAETLKYAVQIADALTRAHSINIVHRDLKPANIMVTQDGLVKVLDFGLAKLVERDTAADIGSTSVETAALSRRTEEGAIVGTVAYMSPEQAEGKKIDARSDIFAFGVVLYEMVTGQRAFSGETRMSTLAAILNKEPKSASEIAADMPRDLDKLIARCLRKDVARRFQHMDDVKIALEELKEESDSGRLGAEVVPAARKSRRAATPVLIAAGAALIVATAGITWWLSRGKTPARTPSLTRLTSDAGLTAYPALSADGKLLACASDRAGEGNLDIWVQQVGGGNPIRLTRHPADDREPAFSPDGTRIAFRSEREGGGIYLTSALGGEERLLVEHGHDPRFSPDGNWIAYWTGDPSLFSHCKTYVLPSTGGQPREIQPSFYSARQPVWSPDGKHLLFWGAPSAAGQNQPDWIDLWVTPLESARPAVYTRASRVYLRDRAIPLMRDPGSWVDDRIIFSAGAGDVSSLWQLRISSSNWQVRDGMERITSSTALHYQPSAVPDGHGRPLIAFTSAGGNPGIWSLSIDAGTGTAVGEPARLTSGASADTNPFAAPDGTKIAFTSNRAGNQDIWILDVVTHRERALTATPVEEAFAFISPDGKRVAYMSFEGDKNPISVVAVAGGSPKLVTSDGNILQCWSADSRKIVLRKAVTGQAHLVQVDVDTGVETLLLKHSKLPVAAPRFSPDGRWIAFQTVIGSLQRQLYIAPVRNGVGADEKEWIAITDGSGLDRNCAWSPDGNLLYFLSERDGFRCFWGQRLDAASKRPAGAPFAAAHFHQARRSLLSFGEVGGIGLSVAPGKIYFSMPEVTGNIWLAKFE